MSSTTKFKWYKLPIVNVPSKLSSSRRRPKGNLLPMAGEIDPSRWEKWWEGSTSSNFHVIWACHQDESNNFYIYFIVDDAQIEPMAADGVF
mmetsp:Transcript_2019/g.4427  ORF Transcript_2019/g.4427 Transcript_2019/m.4427 type:complete len:91 (-) Transcript_2019:361-633(-)